jgi:pyruvate dehydrogenase E1 component alpha subunit
MSTHPLTKEQKLKLYANLVRVRKLDELLVKGITKGKVIAFHSQQGQEAVAVGACSFLRGGDYIFTGHRGHGIGKALARGVPARIPLADHYCKTFIQFFHLCYPELGILGHSAVLGADFVIATGTAIAAELRGKGQVTLCFQGDGTTGRGTFHEAMLMAANWKLPIVFAIENNQYMIHTPTSEIFPMENLADLALGYHIPGKVVDGQDVIAVYKTFQTAIERARAGEGPSLIECKTYRIRNHHEGDPEDLKLTKPRPQEEIDAWKKRDPIKLFQERLIKEGILTQYEIDRIDREATEEMQEADRLATKDPLFNDPSVFQKALYAD